MFIASSDIEDGLTAGADSPVGTRPFAAARRAQQSTAGMLTCDGRKVGAVPDGTSNTILCIEDAGRAHPTAGQFASLSSRPSPIAADPVAWSGGTTGGRRMYAWADPDSGANGLSGPDRAISPASRTAGINNYSTPIGGPAGMSLDQQQLRPERRAVQLPHRRRELRHGRRFRSVRAIVRIGRRSEVVRGAADGQVFTID